MQEKIVETKQCKQCNTSFDITDKDLEFYDKISPVFTSSQPSPLEEKEQDQNSPSPFKGEGVRKGGKIKFQIPTPALCPDCRQQRRLVWRNERFLYRKKCEVTGKEIISIYSPDKVYKIYNSDYWWSDNRDPLDYGRDFDFTRTFFEQYNELLIDVPHPNLLVANNENSEFVNYSANTKNCYLIFASSQNEDSSYSRWIMNSKKLIDCTNTMDSNTCYECIDCNNCTNCFFNIGLKDCFNCYACYDLIGCNNCIGCNNLRNKSYCILNKQYTKDEYESLKNKYSDFAKLLKQIKEKSINKNINFTNVENGSGDYIINSKNIYNGFDLENAQDCKYISNILDMNNSQDIDFQAFDTNNCYDTLGIEYSTKILFSFGGLNSDNIFYSFFSWGCSNLFGCVSLKHKKYCILNKQYTREEYNELVPKIIEHMQKTGEWGEFFPASISPFGYNETVAMEYYPMDKPPLTPPSQGGKQNIPPLMKGRLGGVFNRSTYEPPLPKVEKIIPANKLPENIKDIPDDILNRAIECEITKRPFRIIKQELEFYRKHNLPIPRRHPDQRHLDRMKLRNPRKLFDRKCDKCGVDMKTTYSPDREEIVYCEECYNKEVY